MEYICDAPGDRTWFRLVSEGEAVMESELMRHAVEKYFRREWEKAAESFKPLTSVFIEQDIGKAAHIQREMPLLPHPARRRGRAAGHRHAAIRRAARPLVRLHHCGARQQRSLQAARRCDRGAG